MPDPALLALCQQAVNTKLRRLQQTADALESARRARPRVEDPDGRCYQLSWQTLMNLPDPDGWTLVHGTANGTDEPRTSHAWLEWRGEACYDPVYDLGGNRAGYLKHFGAVPHRRYTLREAALLSCTTKRRYGPWHGLLAKGIGGVNLYEGGPGDRRGPPKFCADD